MGIQQRRFFGRTIASYIYILDEVSGAWGGYSLTKLKVAATNCIRLRRDSDEAELDFGFVGNFLDTAGIVTWLGGANGFVRTWYDQEGTRHYVQTTAANQPKYVTSIFNGLPAILFDGVNDQLTNAATPTVTNDITTSEVHQIVASMGGTPQMIYFNDGTDRYSLSITGTNYSFTETEGTNSAESEARGGIRS